MKFSIHDSTDRGITFLQPEGDLNEASSGVLQERVLELMEEDGRQLIVIDLETTSGASSHALRALLMLSKKLQSVGGKLVICSARSHVETALTLSGLNRLCCIRPDREQAISELMVEERIVRLAKLVAQLLGRAEQGRAAEAV
jgi:anti-anti-sigma factor